VLESRPPFHADLPGKQNSEDVRAVFNCTQPSTALEGVVSKTDHPYVRRITTRPPRRSYKNMLFYSNTRHIHHKTI